MRLRRRSIGSLIIVAVIAISTRTPLSTAPGSMRRLSFLALALSLFVFLSGSLFFPFLGPAIFLLSDSIGFAIFLHASNETHGDRLDVQKIAKSPSGTGIFVVVATTSFSKICNGTIFHLHSSPVIVPSIHDLQSIGGFFLVVEFAIHVSNELKIKYYKNK